MWVGREWVPVKVKEPVGLGGRLPVKVNGGRDPVGFGGRLPVKEGNPDGKPDGKPDGIPDGTWATGAAEALRFVSCVVVARSFED